MKTQVWIAVCVYVLVAIVRKELHVPRSLAEMLQILSVNPFEKTPVFQLLCSENLQNLTPPDRNQLRLFVSVNKTTSLPAMIVWGWF